jgi:uncharacterized membrane protein
MHPTLTGRLVGLVGGAVAGLLFVLLGWRSFLILLAFTLCGLLIGHWIDSQPGLTSRLREAFTRLFQG